MAYAEICRERGLVSFIKNAKGPIIVGEFGGMFARKEDYTKE